MIRLEAVTKKFGERAAVDRLTLEIQRGELLAVLGPSGCGKTTMLRMLGGYEAPDAGRVWMEGADATATPPERRNLGMVFQSYALFPHMTALENVEFGLKMRGVDRRERRERAEQAFGVSLGILRDDGHRAIGHPSQWQAAEQRRVPGRRPAVVDRPLHLQRAPPALGPDVRGHPRLVAGDAQLALAPGDGDQTRPIGPRWQSGRLRKPRHREAAGKHPEPGGRPGAAQRKPRPVIHRPMSATRKYAGSTAAPV